jgi:hypothetical protein
MKRNCKQKSKEMKKSLQSSRDARHCRPTIQGKPPGKKASRQLPCCRLHEFVSRNGARKQLWWPRQGLLGVDRTFL